LATAKSDFESTLDGEISQQVQNAQSEARLLLPAVRRPEHHRAAAVGALPSSVAGAQILNQASTRSSWPGGRSLAGGGQGFYDANQSLFTTACVSRIVTTPRPTPTSS